VHRCQSIFPAWKGVGAFGEADGEGGSGASACQQPTKTNELIAAIAMTLTERFMFDPTCSL
jgi:hypothetical protein